MAPQLAGALDSAAAAQVSHGALHPRDVLLSSDDIRLTGLGVRPGSGTSASDSGSPALHRAGATLRRRLGSARRRLRARGAIARADWGRRVSGLGVSAVESLTKIPGGDLAALQDVFARALAEDPGDRFEAAADFAAALRAACPGVAVAPEPASTPKRRAARVDEPRLPLKEDPEVVDALRVFGPDLKTSEVLPQRFDVQPAAEPAEPPAAQEFVPEDPGAAALPVAVPEIEYQAAVEPHEPVSHEPRPSMPPGLITGRDPDAMSAMERTRSAVWPLVLALVVGIAIGFAGGLLAGSRERPGATDPAMTPGTVPATSV